MPDDIEKRMEELNDPDLYVRIAAAEALGASEDSRAVDALIAALDDGNSNVRTPAAEALGKKGAARAVGPLIATLRNRKDNNHETQKAIAGALGKLGDPSAVEVLTELLNGKLISLEEETARLSAQMGRSDLTAILEKTMKEGQAEARAAAADALEKLTGKRPRVPGSSCFVATACYGSADCPEVVELRGLRDEVLLPSALGRLFVAFYVRVGPPLADWIGRGPARRRLARSLLVAPIARLVASIRSGRIGRAR